MLKVYDCSNSAKRPVHRGGGGPFENDVIRQLKLHASEHGVCFVSEYKDADLILTNDVYPDYILDTRTPRLKRMDGMFYRPGDNHRNSTYNLAATQSDHVIFISEYAKYSFDWMFELDIKSSVSLNAANPDEFYDLNYKRDSELYIAACTDWNREEKRLRSILNITSLKSFKGKIILVGSIDREIKNSNIQCVGYLEQHDFNTILNKASAFINLSYRDPAPKVVCQALAAGLPVFYSESGGAKESVVNCGLGIEDPELLKFESESPNLEVKDQQWEYFINRISEYKKSLTKRDFKAEYNKMLKNYYQQMHNLV